MIVLNCHSGRMSNHKIMQAHVMALALDRGESWRFVGNSWFWKLESATFGRVWNKCVRMMHPVYGSRNRCFRIPGLTIVHGWTELRDIEAMKRHGDVIRRYFAFPSCLKLKPRTSPDEVIVGIHKRRGDYKIWQGGRYYYQDETYNRVMNEMTLCMNGRPVRFEIFSDENSVRAAEEDQHLMAQCDYLIGPPSTFSAWASFMGKTPLLHLMTADQEVRLEDFVDQWK